MTNALDLLADAVFVTHGIFMALAIPSTLLALFGFYRARMHLFHLHNACMAIMVWGRITFGKCPLVELEERLRSAAGTEMAYRGSYVEHVMMKVGVDMPKSSVFYISVSIALFTGIALVLHFLRPRDDGELAPEPAVVGYQ